MTDPAPSSSIDIDFTTSRGFCDFLLRLGSSLVVSTYQTGSLFFIGPDEGDRLAISLAKWNRPMGLAAISNSVFVGGGSQLWRLNNIVPRGQKHGEHDSIYVPQAGWTMGDIDVHDIAVDGLGRVLFVNTLYSCIAEVSQTHSFVPRWIPPTISGMAPEDRCHLNGMAVRDGKLAYASAFATTDTAQGWRDDKETSGVLWDIERNELVLEGLAMPHSPRWFAEQLWLLESGSGRFGWVDPREKTFHPLCVLPGYLRGLTFHGDYAFIGASIPREDSGLSHDILDETLRSSGIGTSCGVFVVEWRTGKLVHSIVISGGVQEIYDVAVLTDSVRPRVIGLQDEDLRFFLSIGAT